MPAPTDFNDLKGLLEHGRALFIYHAGQRLNTINYFFVAFAIFTTAYVSTFTKETSSPTMTAALQTILGLLAFGVTLLFRALDKRNEALVHCDESAQKEIERLIFERYDLTTLKLVEAWHTDRTATHYSVLMPRLYKFFSTVSLGAALLPLIYVTWRSCSVN
jgi:hypothetical protein